MLNLKSLIVASFLLINLNTILLAQTNKQIKIKSTNIKQLFTYEYSRDSIIAEYKVDSNLIKNGLIEYYNPNKGVKRVLIKGGFKDGQLADSILVFSLEGQLRVKGYLGNSSDKKFNSITFPFFKDKEKICIKCVPNGKWVSYWVNSNKQIPFNIAYYKNGKLNGEYLRYNKDSLLISSYMYKNDTLNGKFYENKLNGKIANEGQYLKNKYEGNIYEYKENGELIIATYKSGKLIYSETIDEKTKRIIEKSYWNQNRDLDSSFGYYLNGQLKFIKKITLKAGFEKLFFEDGKLQHSRTYNGRRIVGKDISYFRNGQKRTFMFYDTLSNAQGKSYEWDSLGRITLEENYINDKLNGERKVYENGKLIELYNYKNQSLDGYQYKYNELGKIKEKELYKDGQFVQLISIEGSKEQIVENNEYIRDGKYVDLAPSSLDEVSDVSNPEEFTIPNNQNRRFFRDDKCEVFPHSFINTDSLQKHFEIFLNSKNGNSLKKIKTPISITCSLNNVEFNKKRNLIRSGKAFPLKIVTFEINSTLMPRQELALKTFLQNLNFYYTDNSVWHSLLDVNYNIEIK